MLNVRHIPQKNVNITVKDVTFQSVMIVFPLKKHKNHCVVDVFNHLVSKKEALEIDLQELEEYIYPKYQEIVSNITVQLT